jgi:lantibiotic biosynthesis protein
VNAWTHRATALNDYRSLLTEGNGPAFNSVLLSLLHMHHIRTNGIEQEAERTCRRLARAAALARAAREAGFAQ